MSSFVMFFICLEEQLYFFNFWRYLPVFKDLICPLNEVFPNFDID